MFKYLIFIALIFPNFLVAETCLTELVSHRRLPKGEVFADFKAFAEAEPKFAQFFYGPNYKDIIISNRDVKGIGVHMQINGFVAREDYFKRLVQGPWGETIDMSPAQRQKAVMNQPFLKLEEDGRIRLFRRLFSWNYFNMAFSSSHPTMYRGQNRLELAAHDVLNRYTNNSPKLGESFERLLQAVKDERVSLEAEIKERKFEFDTEQQRLELLNQLSEFKANDIKKVADLLLDSLFINDYLFFSDRYEGAEHFVTDFRNREVGVYRFDKEGFYKSVSRSYINRVHSGIDMPNGYKFHFEVAFPILKINREEVLALFKHLHPVD